MSYELEPGAVGQTTDFKEANKRLEWSLKKVKFLSNSSSSLGILQDVTPSSDISHIFYDNANFRHMCQVVGGAEHTLRAKLTFSQETHGMKFHLHEHKLLGILPPATSRYMW